jgi:hypothetical protein
VQPTRARGRSIRLPASSSSAARCCSFRARPRADASGGRVLEALRGGEGGSQTIGTPFAPASGSLEPPAGGTEPLRPTSSSTHPPSAGAARERAAAELPAERPSAGGPVQIGRHPRPRWTPDRGVRGAVRAAEGRLAVLSAGRSAGQARRRASPGLPGDQVRTGRRFANERDYRRNSALAARSIALSGARRARPATRAPAALVAHIRVAVRLS